MKCSEGKDACRYVHTTYWQNIRTWDMSYVNNEASAQAKINFHISPPFSYRLLRIRAVFTQTGNQNLVLCFSVCNEVYNNRVVERVTYVTINKLSKIPLNAVSDNFGMN